MRQHLLSAIFLAGLLLAGCKAGVKEDTAKILFDPLVHTWPHDLSDIPVDPDVSYGVLENGLRYALQTNSRPEGEASLRFWIRAGSRNETDETLGLAHYLEHMAFNGSENVPEGEMVKSLERLGLSFGADTNASTTFNRTEYTLNLPEVDDETVDYALFLMRETADKLLIEEDAVERERGVVKAEEARGNTPGRKAARTFSKFIYPDTLSVRRPVIGTVETLDTINAKQLRAYYETHYRPERAVIVMTGDFDIAAMETKIKTVFGDWTNDTVAPPDPDNGIINHAGLVAKVYDDDELTTSISLIDARASTYAMDKVATRRAGFVRSYANAIVNQRIRKKLLEADAKVRSASVSYSVRKSGDLAYASASAKNDDWQAALEIVDAEIRRALQYGFQQAEYDELMANSKRGLIDSANYAAKRRSGSLAGGIIGSFAGSAVRVTPQYRLDSFEVHAADIPLSELEAEFKKMWQDFEPQIWLQGPKVEDVTSEDVLASYTAAKAKELAAPDVRQKRNFAYQDFGTPGKIQSKGRVEDFDIDTLVFDNNVRLNLKTTDFEDKWVRLSVTVGEGWNAFPKDQPGLTTLASSIALGGYKAHKVSELSEIFAGKQVGLNMSIGTERLVFSGSTNQDDVEDQLKAWTGLLTAPGYREEWLKKFQESIEASFHTIDSTPGGVAARDLGRIWANGDRRYGMLEKDEYLAMTLEDVRKVLQPTFDTGAIEIGVVGDFDKEAVIAAVAKTFGALPKRKESFDLIPEAFKIKFPAPDRVALTHTGEVNQGAIYLAWPTDQKWTVERSRQYGMLRRVLQNRMTQVIREDMSLAYSPSARLNFSKNSDGYGYISASMSADPQYFEAFEKAAKEIAADLRKGGITQDDLDRARKPVLESFQRSEKENGAWLGNVTRAQTDPEGLEYRRTRLAAYENMTPAALDKMAKELFNPGGLHVVVIGPEKKN